MYTFIILWPLLWHVIDTNMKKTSWYAFCPLPLSKVLGHQVAAYVKGDFLSNFPYILIIFKKQTHKDDLSKLNFLW